MPLAVISFKFPALQMCLIGCFAAMDYPTIDHRGPQFAEIGAKCLAGMKTIFKTDSHAVIYPASGTGAWESALVEYLARG
jgi:alanine-glyoxylate transaminase/serine-glyoxylate transaminase/serine-pyruvate transaminase